MAEVTSDRAYQTRVYKYRALADLPQPALDELRRCHELSNLMIEAEKAHEERVAEAWRQHPELEVMEKEIVAATERIEEVADELKRFKQRNRTTKPDPELKDRLLAARKERKACKDRFREKKELVYPILKPKLVSLSERLREELKGTYKPSINGGMYWANYNAVRDRHNAAVKAVRSRRRMGQPSDLRYRRWTGEGTLSVQLQRQKDQPPRFPTTIADDEKGPWRNVAQLTPAHDPEEWDTLTRAQQRRIRLGKLRFRVGAGDAAGWVELPVIVHRPIPLDADICMMEITRRRLGSRFLVHVSVVVRIPMVPARTEGPPVTLHIGWRSLDDHSIRVGVLTGVTNPPEELAPVLRPHGDWSEIVIPRRWRDQMDYVQGVSSIRSKNMEGLKKWLLEWLKAHPDHHIAGIETIDKWRSPSRFAALSLRARADDSIDVELRRQLEAWRKQDRHLWDLEANLRDKILARRNDYFAKVAAWALDEAALLRVDTFKLNALTRKPDVGKEDPEAHRKARANRVLAAPGMLRSAMIDGCSRRGVQVASVEGKISAEHWVCGSQLDLAEREANVMVWCPKCQTMVDQDVNALEQLCRSA